MNSILKDLYYGNLEPIENFQPISEEYKAFQKKRSKHYDVFEKKLNEADKSLLPLFNKLYDELYLDVPYENEAAFICGFRTGARIMMEILREDS